MLHVLHGAFWAALIVGAAWFLRGVDGMSIAVAVGGPLAFAVSLIILSKAIASGR